MHIYMNTTVCAAAEPAGSGSGSRRRRRVCVVFWPLFAQALRERIACRPCHIYTQNASVYKLRRHTAIPAALSFSERCLCSVNYRTRCRVIVMVINHTCVVYTWRLHKTAQPICFRLRQQAERRGISRPPNAMRSLNRLRDG